MVSATGRRQIEWSGAEVEGGTLTVPLAGESRKGWVKRAGAVLKLLDHGAGRWGQIEFAKHRIQVTDVQEGAEEDLRHLLESVLLQVDAELGLVSVPAAPEGEDAGREPHGDAAEEQAREAAERDRRATAAFRDFADG